MSGYLVAPIAIEIMIPIAVVIPVLFLPIIPEDIGPNLLDIIPAILTPMSYPYYILIVIAIAQGYLVDEYLFPKPHRRFLQPQLRQNIRNSFWEGMREGFRVYTHPHATLSEIIAGRSPKRFFEVSGYEKPLIQYEATKKILYAEICFSIILMGIYLAGIYYIGPLVLENRSYSHPILKDEYSKSMVTKPILESFILFLPKFILINIILLWTIYPVLAIFSILSIQRQFRFYFAQACIKIISDEKLSENRDVAAKANYLVLGLKAYNIYLRRSINLQIRDLKQLFSKLISCYPLNKKGLLDYLTSAFGDENDKLKAARYLSTFVKDDAPFLIKEPLSGKIETWGKFAAAIIPAAFTAIQFLSGQFFD